MALRYFKDKYTLVPPPPPPSRRQCRTGRCGRSGMLAAGPGAAGPLFSPPGPPYSPARPGRAVCPPGVPAGPPWRRSGASSPPCCWCCWRAAGSSRAPPTTAAGGAGRSPRPRGSPQGAAVLLRAGPGCGRGQRRDRPRPLSAAPGPAPPLYPWARGGGEPRLCPAGGFSAGIWAGGYLSEPSQRGQRLSGSVPFGQGCC